MFGLLNENMLLAYFSDKVSTQNFLHNIEIWTTHEMLEIKYARWSYMIRFWSQI